MEKEIDAAVMARARQAMEAKELQVLMGICTGVVADGDVNAQEIGFLRSWLAENRGITGTWVGSQIYRKVQEITHSDTVSDEGRRSLLALLTSLTGVSFAETGCAQPEVVSIPFDEVDVIFAGRSFCFTGRFVFGTRAQCEKIVVAAGGDVCGNVTKSLDYLVIGTNIEPSWINTSYGRKIEAGIAARSSQGKLKIISEQRWTTFLNRISKSHPIS